MGQTQLGCMPSVAVHSIRACASLVKKGSCWFPGAGVQGGMVPAKQHENSAHSLAQYPYQVGLFAAAALTGPHSSLPILSLIPHRSTQGCQVLSGWTDEEGGGNDQGTTVDSPSTEKKQSMLGMWLGLVNHRGFCT